MHFLLLLIALSYATTEAHMAMTIKNPRLPRTEFPRSKPRIGDAYRNPNHPSPGSACHNTAPAGTPAFTLTVGDAVQGLTTSGAGHGGGHCLWAFSTDGQKTWHKFQEEADCTKGSAAGLRHDFVVPRETPAACAGASGCVLGWWWTPVLSGTCETYSNCWDVKVEGAAGGLELSAPSFTAPVRPCVRVDRATHLTPIYGGTAPAGGGTGGGGGGGGGGLPEGVTQDGTGCLSYTIKSGDTLGEIAEAFDVDGGFEAIFAINKDVLTSPDSLTVGVRIKLPCGTAVGGGGSGGTAVGEGVAAGLAISAVGAVAALAAFAWRRRESAGARAEKLAEEDSVEVVAAKV